jgi:molybdate transport system ATP-binding protein
MLNCQFEYRQADFGLQVDLLTQAPVLGIVGPSGAGKSSFLNALQAYCNHNRAKFSLISMCFWIVSRA